MHRGAPVDAQAVGVLEVDEEQRDLRIDQDIPQASEHAVAIIVREGQSVLVQHADEAGHGRPCRSNPARRLRPRWRERTCSTAQ